MSDVRGGGAERLGGAVKQQQPRRGGRGAVGDGGGGGRSLPSANSPQVPDRPRSASGARAQAAEDDGRPSGAGHLGRRARGTIRVRNARIGQVGGPNLGLELGHDGVEKEEERGRASIEGRAPSKEAYDARRSLYVSSTFRSDHAETSDAKRHERAPKHVVAGLDCWGRWPPSLDAVGREPLGVHERRKPTRLDLYRNISTLAVRNGSDLPPRERSRYRPATPVDGGTHASSTEHFAQPHAS